MTLPHKLLRILLSCTLAIAATAGAADYPTQPIHIVVPWAAGGFTDVLGRLIAEKMSKTLGQPVIVDNKPGATGGIGSEFVSRAAPDGYNLLLTTSDALVWNVNVAKAHESDPAKNAKPTYDPIKDFTQIIFMGTQPVLLFVGSDVPARNISEFVAMAKAKPGAVSFGSSGEGSAVHLGMEMFSATSGIKLNHVPYKGINPALLDVIGGQVQSLFISLQGGGAYMKAGKLRPLAITSLTRSPLAPDVPTLAESGYPGFQLTLWYGLAGPKGLPADVVDKLNRAGKAALNEPDVKERLTAGNTTVIGSTPAEAHAWLVSETAKWGDAVVASKRAK